MSALPDKPSELLLVALKDLAAVEAMPKDRYQVHMGVWVHRPDARSPHASLLPHYVLNRNSPCYVCFAGAVMIGTLGCSVFPDSALSDFGGCALFPHSFPEETMKLRGLDAARMGDWQAFINYVLFPTAYEDWNTTKAPQQLRGLPTVLYSDSPSQFRTDMEKAAAILKEAGL